MMGILKDISKKASNQIASKNDPDQLFDMLDTAASMNAVDKFIQLILFNSYRILTKLNEIQNIPKEVKSDITVDKIEKEFVKQCQESPFGEIDFDCIKLKAKENYENYLGINITSALEKWLNFDSSVQSFQNVCDAIGIIESKSWKALSDTEKISVTAFYDMLPIMFEYSQLTVLDIYNELDDLEEFVGTRRFEKIEAMVKRFNEKHKDDIKQ